jgi:antitoxin HicB
MAHVYRVPLVMTPQPEGGYTVTSPTLPGLVTEGDSLEQALENVEDALRATLELYEDMGRPIPAHGAASNQPGTAGAEGS